MTVGTENIKTIYLGNDLAVQFDVTFSFFDESHIRVVHTDGDSVEADLVQDTDYSVTGVSPTAVIEYPLVGDPLATGEKLTVLLNQPYLQLIDFTNQEAYFLENSEALGDYITGLTLQLKELTDRSVKLPVSESDEMEADEYLQQTEAARDEAVEAAESAEESATGMRGYAVNIVALIALTAIDGLNVEVAGFYIEGDSPDGSFVFDASGDKTDHDGVITIDPSTTKIPGESGWWVTTSVSGTGVWIRKYTGPIHIGWSGAKGDGATDDTEAVKACLNVAGSMVGQGGLIYKITDEIEIDEKNIFIDSDNGELFDINQVTTSKRSLNFNSNVVPVAETVLSANVSYNQPVIDVSDSTGFAVGQILHMQSDKEWYYDSRPNYKGETHIISEIDGNSITLEKDTFDSYGITSTIEGTTEIVTVKVYNPNEFNIKNVRFTYPENSEYQGFAINYGKRVRLKNVVNQNSAVVGFGVGTSYNVIFDGCKVIKANKNGTGYGISIGMCTLVIIFNSDFISNRAGVDFTGTTPSRLGLVEGCTASAPGSDSTGAVLMNTIARGFGTHGGAEHIKFTNNKMSGLLNGIVSRGGNITIQGNNFYGKMTRCIAVTYGADVRIFNNIADYGTNHPTYLSGSGKLLGLVPEHFVQIGQSVDPDGKFEIFGNEASARIAFCEIQNNLIGIFTNFSMRSNKCTLNNQIDKNRISLIDGAPSGAAFSYPCVVKDNTVVLGTGIYNGIIGKEATAKNITNITQANPAVVTCVGHGGTSHDQILIEDVEGMTEVNDLKFTIDRIDDDSFSLRGINSTGFVAYTANGTADMPLTKSISISPRYMKEIDDYIETDITKATVSSGTGVLDEVELYLSIECRSNLVTVSGYLKFDMTVGSGRVQIQNMPKSAVNSIWKSITGTAAALSTVTAVNPSAGYVQSEADDVDNNTQINRNAINEVINSERYFGFLGITPATNLILSFDLATVNTHFPVGTGYIMNLDFSYRRNLDV